RRAALRDRAAERGVDAVLAYGVNRSGSAVGWLTGWPVTGEAAVLLTGDDPPTLLVGFANHVPNAERIARHARVRPAGARIADTLSGLLADLPASAGGQVRLGVVGPLPARLAAALAGRATLVWLDAEYTRLRQVKSAEELVWLAHAAALTDASAAALVAAARPGASELDLVAAVESAYAGTGGTNHVHYVAATSMAAPDRCVPGQWPTDRRLEAGSVVTFELSTAWGQDYPGQLLRTVAVEAEPTPLYRELHAAAEAALAAIVAVLRPGATAGDILAAASLIGDAGLRTVDDLVHGLGGGYLPPVVSHRTGTPSGLDAEPLRAGMTVVVQPNVCTPDLRAGVQTGEMFQITESGARSLHCFPAGFLAGGSGSGGAR
ncbi:MAG TPA: M24 family metallopeptidase, partial [Mycobacteriales bacterium]|nr:M24 family metallopeptidase [Mycobacteriales bacterium]